MKSSIIKSSITKIIGIIIWILIWGVASLLISNDVILPSPMQTMKSLSVLIFEENFLQSIAETLFRVFCGFSISVILGIFFGVLSGIKGFIHDFFNPLIITLKSTPVIAIIFIIILWTETNNVPIVVAFLMTFPLIWTNTVQGIKSTDRKLLEMAKSFKVSKLSIIKNIYLPSIKPFIISGILFGVGISWKVTVAAEVISHPRFAIGSRLYESKIYLDIDYVFAWIIVIIILSFIFEYFIKYWIKKLDVSKG